MKNIEALRHSLSHLMASAVGEIYKNVKFGIGPAIEDGFYYDFLTEEQIKEKDLPLIEKKMRELIRENLEFVQKKVSVKEAKKIFQNQPFKLELIQDLEKRGAKEVSLYQNKDFVDLCRGPHVKNTKEIPPDCFKLTKIAGAYWKGEEKNKQLQRIYGVAFENKQRLKEYLLLQKKIAGRDHRVLGEKLDLFHIDPSIGPGLILWHPKGALLKKIIEDYVLKKYLEAGYQLVNTPHIARMHLWEISGHATFYKENMYPPMHLEELGKEEKGDYQLKPMNCPFHMAIYKKKLRSYRDLPLRYTELGTVYRYEKSGVLYGLTRVRGFTQDDAHIFCTEKQLAQEVYDIIILAKQILDKFGFKDYEVRLSVRDPKNPQKYLGKKEGWQLAEKVLEKAIKRAGWKYQKDEGEAVFYGPKIDIKAKDALKRLWQITTIQIDFNLPEKFDLAYIDETGQKQRPYVIHRALLGSLERFIGVLIEHYGGNFPLWLAPIQVQILPISDKHLPYAQKVSKEIKEAGLRAEVNSRNETVSKKIRGGELEKIPYLLVVGDKEEKNKTVRVRQRGKGDIGEYKLNDFLKEVSPS